LLLLDQFGNYVVQCCLRKGYEKNQYIFDAIVDKCWEIGQGRFGARAVRAMLENPIVTTEQRVSKNELKLNESCALIHCIGLCCSCYRSECCFTDDQCQRSTTSHMVP
jgi:hypothetical protein